MDECSTADLVLLSLTPAASTDSGRSTRRRIAEITDALGIEEGAMAERIEVLSALSALEDEGLVERETRAGTAGDRTVYAATDAGRDRARAVRERVADRTILVRDGNGETTVPLDEMGTHLQEPATVRALARVTDDGVLYLTDDVADRFLDREAERSRLRSLLSDATDGEARSALVAGPRGVGKTALLDRLAETARDDDVRVLTGSGNPGTSEPFHPFRVALDDVALPAVDPFERPALAAEDVETYEARRAAMFADVAAALVDLASERPVAVLLDDLDDADRASLELFQFLADEVTDAGVLLAGAYRPEAVAEDHPLAGIGDEWGGTRETVLELSPFDRDPTRALVERVVGTPRVPASFVDAVYERTGGNPLFVEESVRQMLETDAVVPEHDVYPDDPGSIPASDRIEEAIDARLDSLDGDALAVATAASLVGDPHPFALLAAVVDLDRATAREYVDLLEDAGILAVGDEGVGYANDLLRETVAARVSEEDAREIHHRIARAMGNAFDDDREGAARVARHYEEAGEYDRALEQYRSAVERATDVYAHDVAVDYLDAALEIADEHGDEVAVLDVLEEMGDAHLTLGHFEEADRHFRFVEGRTDDPRRRQRSARYRSAASARRGEYEATVEHADRGLALEHPEDGPSDDWESERARLFGKKSWALTRLGEVSAAAEWADRELEIARDLDDPELLSMALNHYATVRIVQGDLGDEVIDTGQSALERAREADDRISEAARLGTLGTIYGQRGEYERARNRFEQALEIQRDIGDEHGTTQNLTNLGITLHRIGEWEAARDRYEAALDGAERIGNRQTAAILMENLGGLAHDAGDLDRANEFLERGLERQRELENRKLAARVETVLAWTLALRGELDEAAGRAANAADVADDIEAEVELAKALCRRGDVARERGDVDVAREHNEDALDLATSVGAAQERLEARLGLGTTYRRAGSVEQATTQAEAALDLAEETGNPLQIARAKRLRGACLVDSGRDARPALTDALATTRDLGARLDECRTLVDLARLDARTGAPAAAGERLADAREVAEETGATLLRRRVEAARRDLGLVE